MTAHTHNASPTSIVIPASETAERDGNCLCEFFRYLDARFAVGRRNLRLKMLNVNAGIISHAKCSIAKGYISKR